MSPARGSTAERARRNAYLVWAVGSGVYLVAVLHRTSLGVAGPQAVERLGLSGSQLGSFVMLQLGLYAAMQVPAGLAIDKWGPRKVLLVATTVMGLAQIGFAFATSYPAGLLARAALGCGDAAVYIAVLRLVSGWFHPRRYAVMAMVTGLFGMAGNLTATIPLTLALGHWGWTQTFAVTGAASLAYTLLLLRPAATAPYRATTPDPEQAVAGGIRHMLQQVREAWHVPEQRLAFWTHQATMGTITAFATLWAFPYLTEGLGYSDARAAGVLTLFVLVGLVAGLVIGPLTGRRPGVRTPLALALAASGAACWAILLAWPGGHPPHGVLLTLISLMSIGGPASGVGFQIARDFQPQHRIATATGIVNVGGFSAAMLGAIGVGIALDLASGSAPPTLDHYRMALGVLGVISVISTVQMTRWVLLCRRRAIHRIAAGEQVPVPAVVHWWDLGYERAATARRRAR